ncbi:MAG: hypothetical protein H6Q91_2539 [Deltaproteobacteria bacterium]|nr:hypothetical protein [Deltaproteobacteria bacterium]
MGDQKALAMAFVLAAIALSCQTSQRIAGQAQRMLRPPGEKLEALPERVAEEYGCDRVARPFLRLERSEIVPARVAAGDAVNHRMVYALCAARPTDVVRGALETRILHEGRTLGRDRDLGYELKPGRWVVDATVEIPSAAQDGIYAIEVVFESQSVRFRDEKSFAVAGSRVP